MSSSPSSLPTAFPLPPDQTFLDVISSASQQGNSAPLIIFHGLKGGLLSCVCLSRALSSRSVSNGAVLSSAASIQLQDGGEENGEASTDDNHWNRSDEHLPRVSSSDALESPSLPRNVLQCLPSDHLPENREYVLLPSPKALFAISSLVNQGYFCPFLSFAVVAGKKGFHYRSAAFPREAFTMLVLLFADCFVQIPEDLEAILDSEGSSDLPFVSLLRLESSSRSPTPGEGSSAEPNGLTDTPVCSDPGVSINSETENSIQIPFFCDEGAALMAREEVALRYLISVNSLLYQIQLQELEMRAMAESDQQKGDASIPLSRKLQGSADRTAGLTPKPDGSSASQDEKQDALSVEISNFSLLAAELERVKILVILCLCASSLWIRKLEMKERKEEEINRLETSPSSRNNSNGTHFNLPLNSGEARHAHSHDSTHSQEDAVSFSFPPFFFRKVSEGQFFPAYESQPRPLSKKMHDTWYDEMLKKIRLAYHDAHSKIEKWSNGRTDNAFPPTIESYLERVGFRAGLEARKLSVFPQMLLYPPTDGRPSVALASIKPPIPAQPHMPLFPGEISFLLSSSVLEMDSCEDTLSLFLHRCTTRRLGPSELRNEFLFLEELTRTPFPPKSYMILSAFVDNTDNVFKLLEKNPEVLSQMVLSFAMVEDDENDENKMSCTSLDVTDIEELMEKEYRLAMKIVRTVLFDRSFSVNVGKFLRELLMHSFLEETLIIDWLTHCCTAAERCPSLLPRKSTLSRSFFAIVNFAVTRLECKLEPTLSQRFNKLRVDAA